MVLELKEYTMASLGYKLLEIPLIPAKQTRPSPFYIKALDSLLLLTRAPPSSLCFLLHPLPLNPATAAARLGGGGLLPSYPPHHHLNLRVLFPHRRPLFFLFPCLRFPCSPASHGGRRRQMVSFGISFVLQVISFIPFKLISNFLFLPF